MMEGIAKEYRAEENEIVIQMKDEGQRFLFSIYDSKPRVLQYGEVVRLKPGFKKVSFKSRGQSIVISSGEELSSNYVVSEVIDTRSLGGERKRTTSTFKIVGGRILDTTPTKSEEQNKAQHPTDGAVEPEKPKE
jgi:hypothetical protein